MAENNPLTVQNATTTSYQFQVSFGGDVFTQDVAGGDSWVVPATFPCDQWLTVTVSDQEESLSYQVLNAVQVIFDADTLGCLAGACEGGCQVNQSS
ncbi:MAG TPA: hypothetical protein VGQ36_08580 [Thermoanaerobaculia bacterium]|jgi:ADP-ribosylglycohydrolase|nr:hypothetical protein [Thermoanaerobaculia bacterium]